MKKLVLGIIYGCLIFYGNAARAQGETRAQGDKQPAARTDTKVTAVTRPDIGGTNAFYTGNRAPLEPLNFIKLPVGSIRAEGWIRKYLELQKDGLTGHLGEISAWLEKKDNAWYSGNGSGSHGWEEVPYWLKGYGDLAYLLKDETMIRTTKEWLEKVFESQRPDGYFGPRMVENEHQDNKGTTPDLWPNMLMLWCMQSYYEYSRDPRVITFMTRYFHWQETVPDAELLKIYWENSRGGDNLYSIYWLYNITGQPGLLDLAVKIHRNTANWTQDGVLPNWHNVNVAQCFREPATYYMQTKDSFYLEATYKDFYLIRQLYGQVPGGMFGADENARQGYSDPRQAVETCGMVEQMASDELLMGITGDPMWGDNCEDVAFNTYPAAVMPDFRGLRYLTAPNMVISDTMNHSPGIQNDGPFLVMNPFSSRCCQHNHSQGWPYYAEHLWMATPDNGVAALLYNSCTVKAVVGQGGVRATFTESTHYPFEDKIRISVEVPRAAYFPVYLRIPGWCGNARVRVNGVDASATFAGDDYAKIERTWKAGDVVELELPMKVRLKTWQANKSSVSVNYGPLTFSLKIKEDYVRVNGTKGVQGDAKWQPGVDQSKWPAYEILPGSAWNYGLDAGVAANGAAAPGAADGTGAPVEPAPSDFTVIRRPWPKDDFPFTQGSAPIEIKTKGREIPAWKVDQYGLCGLLPQSPVSVSTPDQEITLIPMGAARLRISAFPVTNGQTK